MKLTAGAGRTCPVGCWQLFPANSPHQCAISAASGTPDVVDATAANVPTAERQQPAGGGGGHRRHPFPPLPFALLLRLLLSRSCGVVLHLEATNADDVAKVHTSSVPSMPFVFKTKSLSPPGRTTHRTIVSVTAEHMPLIRERWREINHFLPPLLLPMWLVIVQHQDRPSDEGS